jgi:hypothetical protein
MWRFWLIPVCLLLLPCSAVAALDPQTNTPYHFRVVLRMAENRVFTLLFREQTKRRLQEGLQAALGKLGQVEVMEPRDLDTPHNGDPLQEPRFSLEGTRRLLAKVDKAKDLQKAFEDFNEVSESKTHFVRIDFRNGQYLIRTRQFDGLTGLASPVVRHAQTNDRELVVRLAALLIGQDFGAVGTVVEQNPKDQDVTVLFKAGGLGPLTPWVKKGEVFAVAQIKQTSAGLRSFRIGETLLQVKEEPQQGVCKCRLLHRYDNPLPSGPGVLGYRCLKLGTTEAKLRFRLVDFKGTPRTGLPISVSRDDFGSEPKESHAIDADGFTETDGLYKNVAFVQVLNKNGTALAQIPVEILGDRPVVCFLDVNEKTEKLGQFELDRKYLVGRLDESLLAVSGLVGELNDLARTNKSRADALKKAQKGLQDLQGDLATYRDEISRLRGAPPGLDLTPAQERYRLLNDKQKQFKDYILGLEDVIRKENDPKRAELREKANLAQLLENDARFDEAIALYEEVVKEDNNPAYAKHLAELKNAWAPRGPEHEAARAFIYKTWAALQTAKQMKDDLEKARQAFRTCQQVGDKMSPLMLLKANTDHATRLAKRLEALLSSTSAEDQQEVKTLLEVQADLQKLTAEVSTYLREKKPADG